VRTRTTADFEILELAGFASPNWVNYATDTIHTSDAAFKAKFSGDSVEHRWYIGLGKYYTPTFSLNFNFTPQQRKSIIRIPISHVVENKRQYRPCENDSGNDSVTKTLVLTPYSLIYGLRTYVNVEDDKDTLLIKLDTVYNSFTGDYNLRITQPNVPNCNQMNDPAVTRAGFATDLIWGYRQLFYSRASSIPYSGCAGFALIYPKNNYEFIRVTYSSTDPNNPFILTIKTYQKI
jgi:hypothetical protein